MRFLVESASARVVASALIAALTLATLGCGIPVMTPAVNEVRSPGVARITLDRVDEEDFTFMVWNETQLPITVDRSAVVLVLPTKMRRHWDPGFMRRFVQVPAGGVHDVKMEFSLSGIKPGDEVIFDFSSAIISGGKPVPVPPFAFQAGE